MVIDRRRAAYALGLDVLSVLVFGAAKVSVPVPEAFPCNAILDILRLR